MTRQAKKAAAVRVSESHNVNQIIDAVQHALTPMDLHTTLDTSQRRSAANVAAKTPNAVCEAISSLADRGGGNVLGVAVDTASIRQTIAYAAAYERVPAMLRAAAQRINDDIVQRKLESVSMVRVAYGALGAAQRTAAGRALRTEYLEIRTMLRAARKPRGKKAPTAPAAQAAAPATPPTNHSTG